MYHLSSHDSFEIDLRQIGECSEVVDRIGKVFESFGLGLYVPRKDAVEYEPEFPKDVSETDVVVCGINRKRRRGSLSRYLAELVKKIEEQLYPWKMNYDPRQREPKFVFYVPIAEGEMRLYVEFEPKIVECPYCEKGYNKSVMESHDVKRDIEYKNREYVELNNKISLPLFSQVWRFFKKKELRNLKDEIDQRQEKLKQIEDKISKTPRKKMNVLKHDPLSPIIKVRPNYCLEVETISGENVTYYSQNKKPSTKELKEMGILEFLSAKREYPYWNDFTEEKLEITQNLESLALWLEGQIPSIPPLNTSKFNLKL
jgi:hypothetical protein